MIKCSLFYDIPLVIQSESRTQLLVYLLREAQTHFYTKVHVEILALVKSFWQKELCGVLANFNSVRHRRTGEEIKSDASIIAKYKI